MTVINPEWLTKTTSVRPERSRAARVRQFHSAPRLRPFASARDERISYAYLVSSTHVGLLVDVDHNFGAGRDVRRDHHADAIVEHGGLVAGARSLALHHSVGLDD